jgi:hypothetical protein
VARTSSPAFEKDERPTAKRDRPDAVDLANTANRTQKLNPRELLGDRLDGEPASSAPPPQKISGTRAAVTPEEIERFAVERRASSHANDQEPTADDVVVATGSASPLPLPIERPRLLAFRDGRLVVSPWLVSFAIVLALLIGIVVGRLR